MAGISAQSDFIVGIKINVHVPMFEDARSFQKTRLSVCTCIRTHKIFQKTRHALIVKYEMILAKLSQKISNKLKQIQFYFAPIMV